MSTLTTKAVLAALLVALAAPCAARAQYYDDDNGYGYSDPEIRQTVARLAYVSGDVSFARGDDPDDWQPANPNIPMTLGDRAWTAGGRLELQVHGGNLIRLAQSTDLAALTNDLASAFRSAVERAGLKLTVNAPPLPVCESEQTSTVPGSA